MQPGIGQVHGQRCLDSFARLTVVGLEESRYDLHQLAYDTMALTESSTTLVGATGSDLNLEL